MLAEISFKYDTEGGEMPPKTLRRSLDLLLAMQDLSWDMGFLASRLVLF